MKPVELVREYLQGNAQTMQLATVADGRPWISTVYFVADDELNLYWLSWPERRHSREIAENPQVAATVVIKTDKLVIGVQVEGVVGIVTDSTRVAEVMDRYVKKYDAGGDFAARLAEKTNHHVLYALTPEHIQLFDELQFPGESPKAIAL